MFDAEKVTELIAEARTVAASVGIGNQRSAVGDLLMRLTDALSSLRDAAEDAEPRGEYMEGIEEGYKIGKAEDAETQWEYGFSFADDGVSGPYADLSENTLGFERGINPDALYWQRRKAGPWLPVPEGNQ